MYRLASLMESELGRAYDTCGGRTHTTRTRSQHAEADGFQVHSGTWRSSTTRLERAGARAGRPGSAPLGVLR